MNWKARQKTPELPAWKRYLIVGVPVVGFLAAMLAIIFHKPNRATTIPLDSPRPAIVAVAGWWIEMKSDLPAASEFNGFFVPGKVAFVPAESEFSALPVPANARGEFAGWTEPSGVLRAPAQPGLYHLEWRATINSRSPAAASASTPPQPVILDVLVLARSDSEKRGARNMLSVNGKTIGGYLEPSESASKRVRENAARYVPPKFFTTLDASTIPLRLGPDLELGMFVAFKDKRIDGRKVYTTERHTELCPPRPELIDKLNKLAERLRQKGIPVTRFGITSAFRTPDYNRSVGGVPFSRHCYGDAVDLYIDEDNNHRMDDLNGDGRIDRKDGLIIANACRELELEGAVVPGGIGVYEWHGEDSVRSHVHIDCRGYISRWGNIEGGKRFKWWPAEEFSDEDGD